MARIIILGVNPFEDLPGYQLLALLQSGEHHELLAVDDSQAALQVLKRTGADVEYVPHPSRGLDKYIQKVIDLCKMYDADLLLPSTDAHISALSQSLNKYPSLGILYPPLKWLASERLYNKCQMQQWITRFLRTPERGPFRDENDLHMWEKRHNYPIMVKGMRKGAIKCDDAMEAIVAKRTMLRNPANKVLGGGTYLESHVHGEEHSLFLVLGASGQTLATFGFRKLAKTQLGTTLCGQVDDNLPFREKLSKLTAEIHVPITLEIEWKLDSNGEYWVFEVNSRFPSWIGALGAFGLGIVETYIRSILDPNGPPLSLPLPPSAETLFYRLPESGYLPLPLTFGNGCLKVEFCKTERVKPREPLWRGCSPHQFMIK